MNLAGAYPGNPICPGTAYRCGLFPGNPESKRIFNKQCHVTSRLILVLAGKRRWLVSPMRLLYQTSSTVEASCLKLYLLDWGVTLPCVCLKSLPNIVKLPKDGVWTSKISVSCSFSGPDALLKLFLVHAPLYLAGKKHVEPSSTRIKFPLRMKSRWCRHVRDASCERRSEKTREEGQSIDGDHVFKAQTLRCCPISGPSAT